MSEAAQQVGEMIREARKSKGLTQKELGEKLGVTTQAINGYESGGQNLTVRTLKKIADALELPLLIKIG